MFLFGSSATAPAVDFVPDSESQGWIVDRLNELSVRIHAPKFQGLIAPAQTNIPSNLDQLFDFICSIQSAIGQADVELSLVEAGPDVQIPKDYVALGEPEGQLLHTLRSPNEYALLFSQAAFKVPALFFASVARELGKIALDRSMNAPDDTTTSQALVGKDAQHTGDDFLSLAELAAIHLGMGVWVTNGAYIFENSCCGGGCGVNLKSIRTGLSLPEAAFASALDAQRKGLRKRELAKHLEPTQKSALKASWKVIERTQKEQPSLLAAPQVEALAEG